MRYFGKPTEEEILSVKDFRDNNYIQQMLHAEELLDFKSENQIKQETSIKRRNSLRRNRI